jgi:hypothetical protein
MRKRPGSAAIPKQPADGEKLVGRLDPLALAAEQGVPPVARIEDLVLRSWPRTEDVDEFVDLMSGWRRQEH